MVAGRGYIAIATMIFGGYHSLAVACAALLFDFLDSVQMSLLGIINRYHYLWRRRRNFC